MSKIINLIFVIAGVGLFFGGAIYACWTMESMQNFNYFIGALFMGSSAVCLSIGFKGG